MNFDALKDQLRDQWNELKGKIQENSTYQTLKERFEALSINAQRAIIAVTIVFVSLFVISFPYAYISTASENLAVFEENRELIRDLLQAARTVKEPSPLPRPLPAESLKEQINSILMESRLVPEQIADVKPMSEKPAGNMVPAVVEQAGVSISLKKLNLNQIVDLGHRFQSLNAGTKVMGIDILRSVGQTHYFDVVYKVVSFSLPSLTDGLRGDTAGPAGRGNMRTPPRRPPGRASSQTPPAEESDVEESDE